MKESLYEIVARLRRECPWDAKQTLDSIRHLYIEEAYELSEALASGDGKKIEEELADLLYVVLMGVQIAKDEGLTTLEKVEESAKTKLIRRHPHVFEKISVSSETEVLQNWERIKQEEKEEKGEANGFFSGIPKSLPALIRAQMMQERAARIGFDWPSSPLPQTNTSSSFGDPTPSSEPSSEPSSKPSPEPSPEPSSSITYSSAYGPLAKIHEEADELAHHIESGDKKGLEEELGDLLFSVVNLARHIDVRAEEALASSVLKFQKRFDGVQKLAKERNLELVKLNIEELDKLWDEVKQTPQENN